jgi:hypothetical protein
MHVHVINFAVMFSFFFLFFARTKLHNLNTCDAEVYCTGKAPQGKRQCVKTLGHCTHFMLFLVLLH